MIEVLDLLTTNDLLSIQSQTRAFFQRAIAETASGGSPRDENALENLTAFMSSVLSKKYTNPSADIIEVLAGLDAVDKLMNDFSNSLDTIIKTGARAMFKKKAVKASLAVVAGGYQTTLTSYFTHRDLFPGLMKSTEGTEESDFLGLVLLGILVNLNKFEMQNPYQKRLEDFVHVESMQSLVRNIGTNYRKIRDRYVAVQDDTPETWTETTLHLVGVKSWTSHKKHPQPSEDEARDLMLLLPPPTAAISLPTYSFVFANKVFASTLVTTPAASGQEVPFSSFLSGISYLGHNAYRSMRCLHYTMLNLLILQILVEDPVIVKQLCSTDLELNVRLCRQRSPQLPYIAAARIPAATILDICADILTHNLRKRLDVSLYGLVIGIMLRAIMHFSNSELRISYHWSSAWTALLSVVRFLSQYDTDLRSIPRIREEVCTPLASLLAFCLSRADHFLPDSKSYDDFLYKVVEADPVLTKFRDCYSQDGGTSEANKLNRAASALTNVSSHYHGLLQSEGKKHQSPAAVEKIIKQGHETLDIASSSVDDFGKFEPWKESNRKLELKQMIRTVVEDARKLAEQ